MVRIEPTEIVPEGASTAYEVSTDGGTTWTGVAPLVVTAVPPGNQVVYRIKLETNDLLKPPVVDRVRLLQIAYEIEPASNILGPDSLKIRLVR